MKKSFWTFDKPSYLEQTSFRGRTDEEWTALYDKAAEDGTLTPKRIRFFKICIAKARLGRQNVRTFLIHMLKLMIVPLFLSLVMIIQYLLTN